VNTVLAFSAFCGFSFAEDNHYVLGPSKTECVSRTEQAFRDLWVAYPKNGISKRSPKLRV